eukprot:362448_1
MVKYYNHILNQQQGKMEINFIINLDNIHQYQIKSSLETNYISSQSGLHQATDKHFPNSAQQTPSLASSQQQQKPSIDNILEREIRRIVNDTLKNPQQEQHLNFISVCKVLNKTYENSDKLDENNSLIKNLSTIVSKQITNCLSNIDAEVELLNNKDRQLFDNDAKSVSEIMYYLKENNNNQQKIVQTLKGIQKQQKKNKYE